MSSIKKLIRKWLPLDKFLSHRSYSQEGEDMIIRSFYEGQKGYKGFYIDVGAHHPFRFSNTMYFYKRGWKGINIEANPNASLLFKVFRGRDTNLNIGVSEEEQVLTFYCFNESALNGFSRELSTERDNKNNYKIVKTIEVQTYPLWKTLDQYLPPNQKIDFLSIDAEGLDFEILKSNNWEKYRPTYVLIEEVIDLENLRSSEVYKFLTDLNYKWVAKTKRTLFFKSAD